MKEEVTQFYKNLYTSSVEWRPRVERLHLSSIDEDTSRSGKSFEKENVHEALRDIDEDIAPGLDGYTMAIFKNYWEILGVCWFFRSSIVITSLRNR